MRNMEERNKRLEISYIKLKFHIIFTENTHLPKNKVSALRGGMGEMVLRQNCVWDRKCEECPFRPSCLVHMVFYTKMEQKPAFMQGEDSIGYLLECEDYQTNFKAGDGLCFYMTLFGKNIVYFGQYLQAFGWLGANGLGKEKAKFFIETVTNEWGKKIVDGSTINMNHYQIQTVGDYVQQRIKYLQSDGIQNRLRFYTPLTLKYQGQFVQEFQAEAIFQAVLRRIMMYDYFAKIYLDPPEITFDPEIDDQNVKRVSVERYSSTQNSKIKLQGIVGEVYYREIPQNVLPYLIAGELLHIGKNSSFGFGRYEVG